MTQETLERVKDEREEAQLRFLGGYAGLEPDAALICPCSKVSFSGNREGQVWYKGRGARTRID